MMERRLAVQYGIPFFADNNLEKRDYQIAVFFLEGLHHLAGEEMITKGHGR